MKKIVREIFYLGDDDSFIAEFESYMVEMLKPFPNETHSVSRINWRTDRDWQEQLYKLLNTKVPHLIFLDMVAVRDLPERVVDLAFNLKLLKKHVETKRIPFIALFQLREMIDEVMHLFNFGMVYAFIKGDSRSIYRDSYYLGFAQRPPFPKVARAKVGLEYKMGLTAHLRSMSLTEIELESDLSFNRGDTVKLNLEFLELFDKQKFTVETSSSVASSDHLTSVNCKIPYLSPWEQPDTENLLMEDTVETWLANNSDHLKRMVGLVMVVDNRFDAVYYLKGVVQERDLLLQYQSHVEENFKSIEDRHPEIIFMNLDNPDEVTSDHPKWLPNQVETIFSLINFVKTIDNYQPKFVIFNTPSSSQALQKALNYEYILGIRDKMDLELFHNMILLFERDKKERGDLLISHFFKPSDRRAFALIDIDVNISTFSEHEITFYSPVEIPLYSVLKLNVPFSLYLTVVPPIFDFEKMEGLFHYTGFFHGISSEDRAILRRFTYQMIYKAPTRFRFDPFFILEKADEEKIKATSEEDEEHVVEEESVAFEVTRTQKSQSKL